MNNWRDVTDKVALGYFPSYQKLAAKLPEDACVLEIGVAHGGGLGMWRELLPHALLVGVDNNSHYAAKWPDGAVSVVSDQTSPDLPSRVSVYAPEGYDVIVDDASHIGDLSEDTFDMMWPLVKPGGWYVLEDWPVGLPSSPHYGGSFGGDAMVRFAQSFIERIRPAKNLTDMGGTHTPAGGPESIEEIYYRYGMAIVHKTEAT